MGALVMQKTKKIINPLEAAAPKGKAQPLDLSSRVERWFLEQSKRKLSYAPTEHLGIIEVADFPSLGRLTGLRFLEWVQANPEGVISLPTGKTPEYFIKWTQYFLEQWNSAEVRNTLAEIGLDLERKPDLRALRFVQIDEFYPIDPAQHNSFNYYVNKHYLKGFGLDPQRAMLIDPTTIGIPAGQTIETVFPGGRVDLGLRSRNATSKQEELQQQVLSAVDQFCSDYERRIREMGGLGFFLGGVGPDGHIGFNARGSHHFSPTRLTLTNYETEAAAAGDLGGIEVSRNKPVITIGLGTITYNPQAVVIIFAAGDAKSRIVADAVQQSASVLYPASVLHGMPNARMYLTHGAAVHLVERHVEDIVKAESLSDEIVERAVIDRALALKCRLDELKPEHRHGDRYLEAILSKTNRPLGELAGWTRERLLSKIQRGLDDMENQTILHTGPHHDDIMLGYMPYVMHLVRRASNRNCFYVLTSGFTAVTNRFMSEILTDVTTLLKRGEFADDLARGELEYDNKSARAAEVYGFLDAIAARNENRRRRWQARRALANLMLVYEDDQTDDLKHRIDENLNYLNTLYPGKKDIPFMQRLKGMQREFEEELIWAYVGTNPQDVFHGRLGFYTGEIFTEQPTVNRDVVPVLAMLHKIKPTIVTLALDPEGSGPDTHYKVLQVLHEALQQYHQQTGQTPMVWGYRNVWYRYHPAQANVFVPATLNTMAIMEHSFMHCFGSQRSASFPSYEYDGPFCHQAQALWVEQFGMLRTCLGDRWFEESPNPRLRATRGYVFLKEMDLAAFSGAARTLAQATEGILPTQG
jgi:glucosamine-6-phosphate deaminase